MSDTTQAGTGLEDVLRASGRFGQDLLAVEWETTPLGPPSTWSASLATVVRAMVSSRFSMWMAWGPELTFLCNEAYRKDTLGAKYPWALGRSAREVWAEIWPDIGPRIDAVLRTGQATWDEALLLFLERSGFREESYHTFSYSPLTDDAGEVVGMLCVVAEETERVVGARHLALLRELGAEAIAVREEPVLLAAMAERVQEHPRSVPFSLTYLLDPATGELQLAASSGVREGRPVRDVAWPVPADLQAAQDVVLSEVLDEAPVGPWGDETERALVLPLQQQGQPDPIGVLVAGVSPLRPLDATYRSFLGLVAAQLSTAIGSARALAAERHRAETLAELDRAKTAFFTNVSHELRTPLTLLLGPAEDALADGDAPLEGEQRRRVEVIARNGQRLLALVNTLLDFSRLESGRVVARFVPTDLCRATEQLASMFSSAAESAGLTLEVDCEDLDRDVHVDREMWTKVVSNLVANALKFTWEGGITVTMRGEDDAAVLTVADTGIGIAEADQAGLFERFGRVEGARSRSHEGTGIGLALVAELVALHGGTVALDSAPERGTTFTVRIPFGSAHLPREQVAEAGEHPSDGLERRAVDDSLRWLQEGSATSAPPVTDDPARPRVLVVDDNADMRDYVSRLLAGEYRVEQAPDGEAGLRAALSDPPDLVLTDVMMPVLDGFGLLEALRGEPATAQVPVVMVSARGGEDSTIEGLEAGADDYLVKPFSARELRARVQANVELDRARRARDELARSSALLDQAERLASIGSWEIDLERGQVRGSQELLRMLRLTHAELATLTAEQVVDHLIHPDDLPAVHAALDRAITQRAPLAYEARMRERREGWVRVGAEHVPDPAGGPGSLRGFCQDITRQRQVERELEAAAQEREAAAREHDLADELQRSMLPARDDDPPELEVATFYRAGVEGTQVGGDWFDVIPLEDGRTALVLGDVMGRGVRAAAVMGQLRAATRAYAQLDLPPDRVLALLDGVLAGLDRTQMATCVYAVFDGARGTLTYASAGHLPPLLWVPGESEVQRLGGAKGPPLGSEAGHPGAEEVALPPGSLLALYTDGLVERRGHDIEDGIDDLGRRLHTVTSPLVAVPGTVVDAMVAEPDDDVAVLLARVAGTEPERPVARWPVAAERAEVARVRHLAADTATAWGVGKATLADLRLVVSELLANAVLHGMAPLELRMVLHPEHLLVEVRDADGRPPIRRGATREDESGRGIQLVAAVCERWGTHPTLSGKVVWAMLPRGV